MEQQAAAEALFGQGENKWKFSGGMENVYNILQVIMQELRRQQHMTVLWEFKT